MLVGLCGRYGAGKSTVVGMLVKADTLTTVSINRVEDYILNTIFSFSGERDPDWGVTREEARQRLLYVFQQTLDPQFTYPDSAQVPEESPELVGSWIACSLATPLKKIAAALFAIDYEILLGESDKSRELRSSITGRSYSRVGALNGRQCLEFLGTEVFRNHFDEDIWIKILHRQVQSAQAAACRVIIPDVRFPNELNFLNQQGGTLIFIKRSPADHILSEEDKRAHPAAWTFLTFLSEAKKLIILENYGSLEELQAQVNRHLNG